VVGLLRGNDYQMTGVPYTTIWEISFPFGPLAIAASPFFLLYGMEIVRCTFFLWNARMTSFRRLGNALNALMSIAIAFTTLGFGIHSEVQRWSFHHGELDLTVGEVEQFEISPKDPYDYRFLVRGEQFEFPFRALSTMTEDPATLERSYSPAISDGTRVRVSKMGGTKARLEVATEDLLPNFKPLPVGSGFPWWMPIVVILHFLVFGPAINSLLGGWFRLARRYPARSEVRGPLFPLASISLGAWGSYSSVVNVIVGDSGIRLATLLIMRVAHAPILIPWIAIESIEWRRVWFFLRRLRVMTRDRKRITFEGEVARAIESEWERQQDRLKLPATQTGATPSTLR
jgi:hypothetical protein